MKNNSYLSKIQEKIHFVYKWTHSSGIYYIGKHSGNYNDGYIGSGKLFRLKWASTNAIDWNRTILGEYPSSTAAFEAESTFIGNLWESDPDCLNLIAGGQASRTEANLKPSEVKRAIKRKEKYNATLYDAFSSHAVMKYVYSATNIYGETHFINKTPKSILYTLKVLKEKSTNKYPFGLIMSMIEITNLDQINILHYETEDEEELTHIKNIIKEIVEILGTEEQKNERD